MRTVSVTELRRRGLAVLDDEPEGLLVTRHGTPVARLVPIVEPIPWLFGSLAGKIRILGDLGTTGIEWEAERPHLPVLPSLYAEALKQQRSA